MYEVSTIFSTELCCENLNAEVVAIKKSSAFCPVLLVFATRGDSNFRTIWSFAWRVAMSFCNWRRNKAPFKVRKLPWRLLTARCNVESRLKDALEKESVFAASPAISKSVQCATREENLRQFSHTKSFFVRRQWRKGFSGEVFANRALSQGFLKIEILVTRAQGGFICRSVPCLNDYVTRNLLHKMPEKLSPLFCLFFCVDKISSYFFSENYSLYVRLYKPCNCKRCHYYTRKKKISISNKTV